MVGFLSDEWLTEADRALASMPPLSADLVVAYVVTGGPQGERSYHVRFGPDRVAVGSGRDDARVTLVQSWDTAGAVARGERSAQRAFLDGDIRIDGNVQALLGHQGRLATVEDHLGELRSRTSF